ncbi:MAG: hypothetical protein AAGK00_17260, partial [Pseudomonadota bacterium]
ILNAELVEQRPLRNLPRPHHPLDPPVLGSIESGAHSYFKAGFFNTIGGGRALPGCAGLGNFKTAKE